jgi:hypothetical protein
VAVPVIDDLLSHWISLVLYDTGERTAEAPGGREGETPLGRSGLLWERPGLDERTRPSTFGRASGGWSGPPGFDAMRQTVPRTLHRGQGVKPLSAAVPPPSG